MAVYSVLLSLFLAASVTSCKRDSIPLVMGNRVGESYTGFATFMWPATDPSFNASYTGEVHCYENPDLGDKCKKNFSSDGVIDGGRMPFTDNTHYTFVAGKLVKIESIGAGGLIGSPNENLNWNNYLSVLTDRFGKPDRQSVKDALWLRRGYVVHAYLTFGNLPYSGDPAHDEHIVIEDRRYYDQEDSERQY